jgi:hypothetical protein
VADLVTVASVIAGARSLIDDAAGATSDATDILIYVRHAWKRLYSLYIGAEPDRFRTEVTVSGAATIPLPSDWLSTVAVDYQQSAGTRYPLRRLQEADRNAFNGTSSGNALAYRVIGTNLCLYPTPSSGSYVHVYIPTATTIVDTSTTLEVRGGDDEYLHKDIARALLKAKDEAYDGRYEDELKKIEEDLVEKASLRYMRDANEIRSGDLYDWDEGDYRRWR